MGLADSIKQEVINSPRAAICSVTKAKESMKPEDIVILDKALLDRSIKASVLGRALHKEGIDITQGTITRHRNGWCKTCGA